MVHGRCAALTGDVGPEGCIGDVGSAARAESVDGEVVQGGWLRLVRVAPDWCAGSMRLRTVLVFLAASVASLVVCAGEMYVLFLGATHNQAIDRPVLVSADGRTISTVRSDCLARPTLRAYESAGAVRLSLTAITGVPGCFETGVASVTLARPLANRVLLDNATGRPVSWLDGARVLRPAALPPGYALIKEQEYRTCWVQVYGTNPDDINALVLLQCAPSLIRPGRPDPRPSRATPDAVVYYDPFARMLTATESTTIRGAPGQSLSHGDPTFVNAVKWWPGDDGFVVVVAESGLGPILTLDEVTAIAEGLRHYS